MELIIKEIKLSKFDKKSTIVEMRSRGHSFCWGLKKPEGYITYYEVVNNQRVRYKNNYLTAYMRAQNEQKQTESSSTQLARRHTKVAEGVPTVRTREGEGKSERQADLPPVGNRIQSSVR